MAGERRDALPKGYQFEGYRIDGVLGAGGFGMTYRATEIALERTVAIKEFLPGGIVMRDADRITVHPVGTTEQRDFDWGLASFRKEAATLVTFRHPNIVTVHRYFEANGTAYMVMAYEDGESLGSVLARHPTLDESEIREILLPLLDGLARVHEAGFLHRDIKPDNIYIRQDGSPVLLDFGAARQALGEKSRSLTSIFTAGYAPFEQYSSRGNQGPWTDIYALGAVLYRCVTGDKPPEAPDRVRDDPCRPAAEAAAGRYARGFLAAIDHALAVDEHARPPSVAAWRTELGLDTLVAERPARPRRRGGWAWAAAAALVFLAAAGGAVWYTTKADVEAARLASEMKALERRAAAAEAAAKAELEARREAEAEAEAKRQAAQAARLEAEQEAAARAEAEAAARTAAAARAQAEEEARRRAEAEAKAAAEARARAEAAARAEAEARARAEAEARARAQAEEQAKRRATAAATQQASAPAAASALRALLVGKTASFDRPVPGKPARAYFNYGFGADGKMSFKCHVVRLNNSTGPCQRPDGQMPWTVEGDRLCIGSAARQSCVVVSGGAGGGSYVFRKISGDNPWLDGEVEIR